jgi:hypothetical protein
MERITWSGVALHQGPGVGHQASHGCIRMPQDFAARLWQLQTMGMRVIIARPELRPTEFADPHLFVHKNKPPTPTAALPPVVQTAQTVDPGTRSDVADPPAAKPSDAKPSDAKSSDANPTSGAPVSVLVAADPTAASNAHSAAPVSDPPPASKDDAAAAKPAIANNMANDPAPTKPVELTLADVAKKAASDATAPGDPGSHPAVDPASHAAEPVSVAPLDKTAAVDAAPAKPSETATAAPPPMQPAPPAPAGAANDAAAPTASAAPTGLDDVPLPLTKPPRLAEGGHGPIAIFVSRKEGKIYVRQDFTPMFDAPVKIEHPDQPLGTHVFTALDYLPDHSTFRWTVTTLPSEPPKAVEQWKYVKDADGKRKRVRVEEREAASTEPLPSPETPQEALARIDIPQDVIDQISQLIVPGSSLVISDHGLGPETGEGTDFIVVTR